MLIDLSFFNSIISLTFKIIIIIIKNNYYYKNKTVLSCSPFRHLSHSCYDPHHTSPLLFHFASVLLLLPKSKLCSSSSFRNLSLLHNYFPQKFSHPFAPLSYLHNVQLRCFFFQQDHRFRPFLHCSAFPKTAARQAQTLHLSLGPTGFANRFLRTGIVPHCLSQ